MRAILEIGDMKIFGEASLYGIDINFIGRLAKPKRKLKDPWKTAAKRLERNCITSMNIMDNGHIFLGPLLSYGCSIDMYGSFTFNTSHKLSDR